MERQHHVGMPGSAVSGGLACTAYPTSADGRYHTEVDPAGIVPTQPSKLRDSQMQMETPAISTFRSGCTGGSLDRNTVVV